MATTEEVFGVTRSQLFEVLIDPASYPQWLVGAQRIRSVSDDWPQPRSSFAHTVGFGPWRIADSTILRAIRPPELLQLHVRARPLLEAVVTFEVETARSGCRLRMSEAPTGIYTVLSAGAQPLIHARNRQSLQRLKTLVEQR